MAEDTCARGFFISLNIIEMRTERIKELVKSIEDAAHELDGNPITPFLKLLQDYTFATDSVQNGYGLARRDDNENPAEVLAELRENITHDDVTAHMLDACLLMDYINEVTALCELLRQEMA